MKLNKPPVSQEQTILEEYVEFLLTDLSNVHPISGEKHSSISELVAEKSAASTHDEKPSDVKVETADKAHEQVPQVADQNSDKTKQSEEPPKWSTIEKAAAKRKSIKPDEIDRPLDRNRKSTDKQQDVLSASSVQPEDSPFDEPSEEEQLKEWDAIITQEKEAAILAELDEQPEGKSSGDKANLADFAQAEDTAKAPAANKHSQDLAQQTRKIIEDYLPPEKSSDPRLANVEKLLSRISLATMPKVAADSQAGTQNLQQTEVVTSQEGEQSAQVAQATFLHREAQKTRDILPEVFQTLIFQVGRLPLAVPLLKLGGIVKISSEDVTPLVGTPEWFMGLVPNDRGNLMVVDTQKYLMPEQVVAGQEQDYQYLIVLDNSNWALACNSVGDAKNLTQQDIRWAEKTSKRPWFAGMVVDYMSALIEVDELINMLADNISE